MSALTVADGAAQEVARSAWDMLGDMAPTLQGIMSAFVTMPLGLPVRYEITDSTREAGRTEVTFRGTYNFEQKLVLTLQADETWGVDPVASWGDILGSPELLKLPGEEALWSRTMDSDPWKSEERLQALYTAFEEYAGDHGQRLPAAERWVDELEPYVLDRTLFGCPASDELEYGYAMNAEVGAHQIGEWETDRGLLLLVEWPGGERNAVVAPDAVPQIESCRPEGIIVYMDAAGFPGQLAEGMTFESAREAEESDGQCRENLRLLARAARQYARDHEGLLPPADAWQDELAAYLLNLDQGEAVFTCPAAPGMACGYAINAEIAGKVATELTGHDELVLFFESDLDRPNAAGSPDRDTCPEPRHLSVHSSSRSNNVAYLSGEAGMAWGAAGE